MSANTGPEVGLNGTSSKKTCMHHNPDWIQEIGLPKGRSGGLSRIHGTWVTPVPALPHMEAVSRGS